MLEFVRLHNLKTLQDVQFEMGPLTIFSGLNGMGKSTLIQSLLLLRQSFEEKMLPGEGLLLNGKLLEMGVGADAFSQNSEEEFLEFILTWTGSIPFSFRFKYQAQSDVLPLETPLPPEDFTRLSLFGPHFQYLAAERITPKASYRVSEYQVKSLRSLGITGEFTAHFLDAFKFEEVRLSALRHPDAASSGLLDNVEAWMSKVTPGVKIRARALPDLNLASLGFAFVQGKDITREFKPQNVGFGLTYVLPVVTALLAASPGDLVIIENPESHLHPSGQAILGRMAALAASSGVQLLIETHSDHFLNGVRVAVREQIIAPENVRLFFLERDDHEAAHSSRVICPRLDASGSLDQWPTGFFDEWDRQLDQLL
jgi:predicted ATPase